MGCCQSSEMNHIEHAPVIKKAKTIREEAEPASRPTCSRIRLLPEGRPKAKKKVRNHMGTASPKGWGIRVVVITREESSTPE